MSFATVIRWTVGVVGVAALVYALVPPVKPQYLSAAGSLLGVGPVLASAVDGDDEAAAAES